MSSPIPLPFPPGRPDDLPAWARQVHAYLRANELHDSPGVRLNKRADGATLDVDTSVAAPSAAQVYPWQLYLSPWTGTGADPNAATRKMRFRLARGKIAGRTPVNATQEFLAFGDATDDEIEENDAVNTQVYLQVPVSESTLGSGDLTVARPTLMIVEGDDLADAVMPPAFGDDGSLPAYIVVGAGEVSYWGGSLHFQPGYFSYLWLTLANGGGCESTGRNFILSAVSNYPDL